MGSRRSGSRQHRRPHPRLPHHCCQHLKKQKQKYLQVITKCSTLEHKIWYGNEAFAWGKNQVRSIKTWRRKFGETGSLRVIGDHLSFVRVEGGSFRGMRREISSKGGYRRTSALYGT